MRRAVLPTLILFGSFSLGCGERESEVRLFDDVTASSPLASYVGMTYGAAWGDIDGDGLPDLYITNHLKGTRLFRNLGRGQFAEATANWLAAADVTGDKHGAAWGDFDNDGRLDLVQLMGAERGVGAEQKRLFVNRGERLENVAEAVGLSNPLSRTRMPLWVDLDGDGLLDVFHGAEARSDGMKPPFLFIQRRGKFDPAPEAAVFAGSSAPFCILTHLTAAGTANLVCRVAGGRKTAQVFQTGNLPLSEVDLLPVTAFEDIAAGDFNNDGFIDLYLARKNAPLAVAFGTPSPNELIVDTSIDRTNVDKPLGFSFRTSGQLNVRVAAATPSDAVSMKQIHLGRQGQHPAALEFQVPLDLKGVPDFKPGLDAGIYIGKSSADSWKIYVSGALHDRGGRNHQQIALKLTSSTEITGVDVIDQKNVSEEAPARLFINHGGKLVEESEKRGVNKRAVAGVNVVAADFDNDMDVDLFVVASGDVGKKENLLLLNRGDGHFDLVKSAGGAGGERAGVGDSVTSVDFDGDGFIDLLVTTGGSMGRSLGLPSENGGYRLYRNAGNGNNWLQIDLEGTKSNRDGIGARVDLFAGGVKQVRIQDGGIHHRGQNHMRLHFGLAKHGHADKITIRWPSGTVQELSNVKANQVLRIKEP